jgi:hypothetical protein
MLYQLIDLPNFIARIDGEGLIRYIPNDPANRDWQEYQLWLADGNEPLPAPEEEGSTE